MEVPIPIGVSDATDDDVILNSKGETPLINVITTAVKEN